MDLEYSEEYRRFADEVRAFLAEQWPPKGEQAKLGWEEQASSFRERAIERGYLARHIPRQYGGSEQESDVLKGTIIGEEFAKAGAPGEMRGIGPSMLVPTLVEHGAEWQKEQFVGPTIRGEMHWCQGYSEPGAGSDLASLKTRAELDGDEWVINGQKIWTTMAHIAQYMFCLCRTEPDAPKHAGISYILIDMKTPGIDVRPLKTMTGMADFNEVFLDDVRVPARNIVGKRGAGWLVSRSTLKHERNMIGGTEGVLATHRGLVKLAQESARDGRPAIEDPRVQDELIQLEGFVEAHRYSSYQQLTLAARGESAGLAGLLNKLSSSNLSHRSVELAMDLIGDDALSAPGHVPLLGTPRGNSGWVSQFMWSLALSIGGGTANIQRNVIAERGLGLPRDQAANSRG